jgi:hypothetical protein
MTSIDTGWVDGIVARWGERAGTVLAGGPVPTGRVWQTVVECCAPFAAGTRFFVVPEVRFLVGDGWLRAPGELLPGEADRDLDGYLKRLDGWLDGDGVLVTVREPLVAEPELWAAVRGHVAPLWRHVGRPDLPVATELLLGDGVTRTETLAEPSRHALLTWVLSGTLRTALDGGVEVVAHAGELAYCPAGARYADAVADRCLAVRLRIPVDGRLAAAEVRAALADLAQALRGNDATVPYLPYPAVPATGLGRAAEAAGDPRLGRMLRTRWLARRSAGGLEPAPPPQRDAAPPGDRPLRAVAPVLAEPDPPDGWLWAVNGHAFRVVGGLAERIRVRLTDGPPGTADDVCRAVGVAAGDPRVLALLTRLHQLRAIEEER